MIDKKKIEEAAGEWAAEHPSLLPNVYEDNKEGFAHGAEWAQREFVKSLWHKASEKPEKFKPCLVYGVFTYEDKEPIEDYFTTTYTSYGWTEDYFPRAYDGVIKRWCYIDDILPKEGGEK